MSKLINYLIEAKSKILDALTKLNKVSNTSTLFVIDNGKLVGTLTDGDVRRGFIKGLGLSDPVEKFMALNFHFFNENEDISIFRIKEIKNKGIELLPILNNDGIIIDIINLKEIKTILPVDAVLMAGGMGERLRPLTERIPKPLLKIGGKPIIEHLLDHLKEFGIRNFYITLFYLGNMIEKYLGDGRQKQISIKYIYEPEPLGTIGSIRLINDFKNDNILIMNTDICTNIDVENFYESFYEQKADMSIASVSYSINIPYAVLNINEDRVNGFNEKPIYKFNVNSGIYLIRKELVKLIPEKKFFDATDFIKLLINSGKKVIHSPIIGFWNDIGSLEDFKKAQKFYNLNH